MDELRKAHKAGVLVGLRKAAGLKPRLDIDVLLKTKQDTFNLFVLALSALQNARNTHDPMGYYQIAGIHGLPKAYWDDVAFAVKDDDVNPTGYCAHRSIRFPTWHRSYLALLEQSIYLKMADIAETFPEAARQKYRDALKDFRLPYWDYYRPRGREKVDPSNWRTPAPYKFNVPRIFTEGFIVVRRASDDKLDLLPNPLYSFIFPTETDGGFGVKDWPLVKSQGVVGRVNTLRYPGSGVQPKSDQDKMNATVNSGEVRQPNTTNALGLIGNFGQSYESFSSTVMTQGASGSLEGLHNVYHGYLGGPGGWMSTPPTAAFDPIFWFHHNNIERYNSIWQAANPSNRWPSPQNTSRAGWNDFNIPNMPFRRIRGATPQQDVFWTADDVKDPTIYGNYYEDAYDAAKPARLVRPEDFALNFQKLYAWSVREGREGASFGTAPKSMEPLDLINKTQVFDYDKIGDRPVDVGPSIGHRVQEVFKRITHSHDHEDTPPQEESTHGKPPEAQQVLTPAPAPTVRAPAVIRPGEEALQVNPTPAIPGASTSFAFTNIPVGATDVAPADIDESKFNRDWYIDDVVEAHAFNDSFSIYFFIGPFTGDETGHFGGQSTEAGHSYIFVAPRHLCDNCGIQADEGQLVTATSPITPILLDYIGHGLENLSPAKVVPFLIENLKWRIVTAKGERKDPRETAGFKVGLSSKLTPRDGIGRPSYQEFPQVIDKIIERAARNG